MQISSSVPAKKGLGELAAPAHSSAAPNAMSTPSLAPAQATEMRLAARFSACVRGSRGVPYQNIVRGRKCEAAVRGSPRRASRPIAVRTTARLSGLGGPRVANESREDNQMLVAKTLLTVREGDLLSLTVTPGDGGGHLASGEDETREIWMTVTKISTSTGGRRQLEGESNGLRVQLIDQGRGLQGARLGVAGPVLARDGSSRKDRWMDALRGWREVLARPADLERNVLSSVTRVAVVASLDRLEQALETDHRPWTTGSASPARRAVIVDPVEAATQTAGELLALLKGKRDVVLCQLHAGWLAPDAQPILCSPWALEMLRRCVEDEGIRFEMSESDDVEAHAGLSVALYRATGAEGTAPERARSVDPALAARTVAALGAQADCPAVTPYERVLVGMALGYSERDVAYHHKNEGGAFSATYFARARQALGIAESIGVADAGAPRVPPPASPPAVTPTAVPNMEAPNEDAPPTSDARPS